MKRSGYSYISTLISALLISVLALAVMHISAISDDGKHRQIAERTLTHAMINITESLKADVAQNIDISSTPIDLSTALYNNIKGDVIITKEYALSSAAAYVVRFKLRYRQIKLNECVVIYCNE